MSNQEHKMTVCKEKIIKIYNEEYLNGISMVELYIKCKNKQFN